MAKHELYDAGFFESIHGWALESARRVVPVVFDLIRPNSVVDVGCGDGTWLSVFLESGVNDGLGIDGDYIDRGSLLIPVEKFRPIDLQRERIDLGPRFDLAVSLEVAEHLGEPLAAGFVSDLTSLAPVVLFSAAIPHQQGVGHVNEQWPDYWVTRFASCGFQIVDRIGLRFWDETSMPSFYAQNMFLFAEREYVENTPMLAAARNRSPLPLRLYGFRFTSRSPAPRSQIAPEARDCSARRETGPRLSTIPGRRDNASRSPVRRREAARSQRSSGAPPFASRPPSCSIGAATIGLPPPAQG